MPDADLDAQLAPLRQRIDEIDARLIELMNERARVALGIGDVKRQAGGPHAAVYMPHREKAVLDKIRRLNAGPLPDNTLDAIWREIMSGSVRLQTPLRIAYLGPAGSFSHAAAGGKFGSSVEYVVSDDIPAVFQAVARGHADYGLVPVENSMHGGVVDTLDAFLAGGSSRICAEVLITVHHNCLSRGTWEQVKAVGSKPEVFTQCRQWLSSVARGKEVRPMPSTSAAAEAAASDPTFAAIGSRLASEIYDVPVLFDNIEDDPDNVTRFFVIGREGAKPSADRPRHGRRSGVCRGRDPCPGGCGRRAADAVRRHAHARRDRLRLYPGRRSRRRRRVPGAAVRGKTGCGARRRIRGGWRLLLEQRHVLVPRRRLSGRAGALRARRSTTRWPPPTPTRWPISISCA